MALEIRFASTCLSRRWSARTASLASGSAMVTLIPARSAIGRKVPARAWATSCGSIASIETETLPLSILAKSSTSSISASRWRPAVWICSTASVWRSVSGLTLRMRRMSAKPITAFSGVRSS